MTSMKKTPACNQGFVAIISAIMMSLILIGLVMTMSMSGFLSRFTILDYEFKQVSLSLAESCAYRAFQNSAENVSYAPVVGGEIVLVASDSCTIESIQYGPVINAMKTADIQVRAEYHGAFTQLRIRILVHDPLAASVPTQNIQIVSWQEVP
jgi:hypothetical protein